jgi:8-oxo-dGTP pyrophosphatase MutT (NUDIX family)
LHDQADSSFGAHPVTSRDEVIGIEDTDEAHFGKVESLGDHRDAAVARELIEETGFQGHTFLHWYTKEWRGFTQFEESLYLAKGLTPAPQGMHLDGGEKIEVVKLPWKKLVDLCLRLELRGPTLANCILAMEFDPETRARRDEFLRGL